MPDEVTIPNQPADPNIQPTGQQPGGQPEPGQPELPDNFDDWLKGQPDEVKDLVDGHTKSLQTALKSERDERKRLTTQLRELEKKLETGSEAQKAVQELTGQVELSERRADFYAEATVNGVTGNNIRLAWTATQADGLIDEFTNGRSNKVDWDGLFTRLKGDYPNLFQVVNAPAIPRGNAGNGTNSAPAASPPDMNRLIINRARGRRL